MTTLHTFAHFSGPCPDCDEPIAEGDHITRTPDGWAHADHRPGPSGRIESTETCGRCWLLTASGRGSCGCEKP